MLMLRHFCIDVNILRNFEFYKQLSINIIKLLEINLMSTNMSMPKVLAQSLYNYYREAQA